MNAPRTLSSLAASGLVAGLLALLCACDSGGKGRHHAVDDDDGEDPRPRPAASNTSSQSDPVQLPDRLQHDQGPRIDSMSNAQSMAFADLNGDETEDFIALCSDGGSYEGDMDLCAFDGGTFEGMWRRGPFVARSLFYTTQVEIAGGSVIAMMANGATLMLDPETGAVQGQVTLPGRVTRACVPDPKTVWIDAGGVTGSLDVAKRTFTAGGTEPSCSCLEPGVHVEAFSCRTKTMNTPFAMKTSGDGTTTTVVRSDFNDGASIRNISSIQPDGTPIWTHPIAPGDPLLVPQGGMDVLSTAGGRTVTSYEDAQSKVHVIAFDGKTGATLWDVPSRSLIDLRISTARAYVLRWQRIDVLDVRTGVTLGGIGSRDGGERPTHAPLREPLLAP